MFRPRGGDRSNPDMDTGTRSRGRKRSGVGQDPDQSEDQGPKVGRGTHIGQILPR